MLIDFLCLLFCTRFGGVVGEGAVSFRGSVSLVLGHAHWDTSTQLAKVCWIKREAYS